MLKRSRIAAVLVASVVVLAAGAGLAQSALAQLGLTEAAARKFLFDEMAGPTGHGRRSEIAVAGQRAFYKLSPAARGAAATGLFTWAKAYVNSPAFTKAYAEFRQGAGAVPQEQEQQDARAAQTVDEEVKAKIDEMLAAFAQAKQAAASMAPADRAKALEMIEIQEAQVRSPETAKAFRTSLEVERAGRSESMSSAVRSANDRYPADPQTLFARRLHEFLDATADADFSAGIINLTGGADGHELVDPAHRQKHWMWQAAVVVGPEATAAARAAGEAWLKEIER